MANTYVWSGGYTGSTGFNSGYSGGVWYNSTPYVMDPNSPCVGSDDPCCDPTNPACSGLIGGGLTSSIGDIWFTPYYWGNAKNWKKQIQATGGGLPSYVATTTLPKGGDNVIFTGNTLLNANGQIVNLYPYSCLWGGMSGDGYTASGSTGWVGGYTAGSGAHTNISFNVNYSFKKDNNPSFFFWGNTGIPRRSGEIGAGGNTAGNFDYTTPLKIRASQFAVQINAPSVGSIQPLINVNNLASSSSYTYFNMIGIGSSTDNTNGGVAFLRGNWGGIYQSAGSVYADKIEGLAGSGYWNCVNNIVKMSSSSSCAITNFNYSPSSAKQTSYIWGKNGGSAELNMGGATFGGVPLELVIGGFGGASTPPFTYVKTSGPSTKNLVLAGCQINDLSAESNTHITVHPNITKHDYCIIRDGYINGNSSLNRANPSNENWRNFTLGLSASDDGLRIDDNAVTIKGFVGQSLKTGFVQDNKGVTAYLTMDNSYVD